MSITKTRSSIWSSQGLSAGGADTTSSWIDLSASYGASVDIKLTNGSTGPTVAAQVKIEVANNYNGGSPTLPVQYGGAIQGGVANNGVASWSIPLGPGVAALRLVAGSNTGQDVTVDADISAITAI